MVEFKAILSVEEALIAVKRNGYALQYVPTKLKTRAIIYIKYVKLITC